ncbi:acyltransferase family protein [Glycomyces arizonensis]|uniref:acyltransferase family protein n=1 Tax=Glycomyces arizonensis TaxID=256035 RepID=UPI0003F7482E|nr:acyltransferase family protein [Glycomyces arizonensis]
MSTETSETAASPERRPTGRTASEHRFLPEIEGLRGAAIVVIAVYHIWFNRVSGGVDVFLLLSGFFITGSLVRAVESGTHGDARGAVNWYGIDPARYAARIVRRIFPPALIVAAATLVMAVVWLPRAGWNQQVGDVLASAFYIGNWRLAENAVDYLSSNNGASIIQHYWSLGVQAQFYLLWPILIAACAWIAVRTGRRLRGILAIALTAVFAASFAFALWEVANNQAYAYFDTRARLWQFAIGGLLVLALPHLKLGRRTAGALSWVAVVALAACGMVLDSTQFPGLAALWPVLAAAAVIAVATAQPGAGAGRLLQTRPLQSLGRLSYALYLWHWPVLICYLATTGRDLATLAGGLGVIAVSFVLAAATHWALEVRLKASGLGQRTIPGAAALGAASLALALAACGSLAGYIAYERDRLDPGSADADTYPGAAALAEGLDVDQADFIPSTLDAADDRDPALSGECNQTMEGYELVRCDFIGDTFVQGDERLPGPADESGAERTVVMYGGSKIWHWLPAMQAAAERNDWHVITFIKNACIIATEQPNMDEERYRSCAAWNDAAVEAIVAIAPDIVFTYGSRVGYDAVESFPAYNERYEQLLVSGAEVVAVRDTPSPRFDMPTCVDLEGADAEECTVDRGAYYPDEDAFDDLAVPESVHKIDFTDYLCSAAECPPVVGNILVYRDDAHMTNTYAATLAPYLEAEMLAALGHAMEL